MYVIWITYANGENGYFSSFEYGTYALYVDSIHDARKFPTLTAAESVEDKIREDYNVSYTEIIEYNRNR